MFCTYCKQARVENETPCPHCGAPSPLLQVSGIGQWSTNNSKSAWTADSSGLSQGSLRNSWTYGASPQATGAEPRQATEAQWENTSRNQPSLPSSLNASWSQMSPVRPEQNMSAWQDNGAESQTASQALLPVLYQEPQGNDMRKSTVALQLIPENAIEHLLPERSETSESVYVPPLYTQPRPLIPKYRIISGTLSVLIVALLLCGGIGYYAQASGTIANVVSKFTGAPPTTTMATPTVVNPGAPVDKIDNGPAQDIIPSGTTTLRITQDNVALGTDKVFKVNQTFYVTYTVQAPEGKDGNVMVKWYMDGQFYNAVTSPTPVKAGTTMNGSVPMQYAQPAQGTVEIYWNQDLGKRFYFVVQTATN
jgi:hypothetical protein